ncbi:MAG: SBBP repeat-containing protein [Chloroflexota bacterium]
MIGLTMFKHWRTALGAALLASMLAMGPAPTSPPTSAQENTALLFIENVGQFPGADTRFLANLGRMTLHLAEDGLWLTVLESPPDDPFAGPADVQPQPGPGLNLKLTFAGANPAPPLEPFAPLDAAISYFVGHDPANWQTGVPVWGGVRYVDLYPGLDLEISGENGRLSLCLVIKDETVATLSQVHLLVEGAEAAALDGAGGLRLSTALGDITLPLLQVLTIDGAPVDLAAVTPEVQDLEIIAPFSSASLLPPAPADAGIAAAGDLIYSTFIGSNIYFDSSQDITIDEAGYAYLTGRAYTGFPTTPGVFDPTVDGFFNDAFVAKLSPDGSSLVYATLLGGDSYAETGYAIAVDGAGNAYVTGYTASVDFPVTPGAFDDSLGGESDAFVAKIDPSGAALLYATLVGGDNVDHGQGLALDDSGQVYLTGFTRSTDFPATPGALAPGFNGGFSDIFAVKVAADGSSLAYATYIGGGEGEFGYGIALDETGSAYLTGYTNSVNFPTTPGAWDTSLALGDAFVLKLNPAGSSLVYSTFLGGSIGDSGRAIVLDNAGSAYITGRTDSPDFPATPDAFDTSYNGGGNDIFVARLAPDGNGLFYATYLGGNNEEEGRDLAVDAAGSVYVTGFTYAGDFPTTPDAFAPACSGCSPYLEAFVSRLNPNGTALLYGSYLGGGNHDYGYGLAQDGNGYVYLTGETQSADFPTTPGAFDTTLGGYGNGFVTKLFVGADLGPPPSPLPDHSCAPTWLDTFTVQQEPRGLALDPDRQRLYVANFGSDSVSVVDSSNDNVLQTIPGLDSANGLAYDPDHNLIWVTNYLSGQVTPIQANGDATDFTVLPPLAVGAGPWGVAYDPVHHYVYIANSLANSVAVVNADTQTLVTTLSGSFNQPFHLAANPVTGKVYVANSGHNSVTVINGAAVSKVVQLWDSGRAYGLAVDETRHLVYVATVQTNRIVALGPLNGQPDQFLGWASFQRGYNPNRRVPLRAIAVDPQIGPAYDGGHVWATTSTGDGSEANQTLFIPKGWSSRFHVPFAQTVGDHPTEGLAIDRTTHRVYVTGGTSLGLVSVFGDHATVCGGVAPAAMPDESDEITIDIYTVENLSRSDVNGDGQVDIFDLALAASRYGGSDPTADLNGDAVIDVSDLTIIAGYYGQTLPGGEE